MQRNRMEFTMPRKPKALAPVAAEKPAYTIIKQEHSRWWEGCAIRTRAGVSHGVLEGGERGGAAARRLSRGCVETHTAAAGVIRGCCTDRRHAPTAAFGSCRRSASGSRSNGLAVSGGTAPFAVSSARLPVLGVHHLCCHIFRGGGPASIATTYPAYALGRLQSQYFPGADLQAAAPTRLRASHCSLIQAL